MSSNTLSKSQHIFELATDLLDDIELSRLDVERLLLKCSRLARWTGSDETQAWIGYEMSGYFTNNQICLKYMGKTGRWIDSGKKEGYWGPLAQQEASIEAKRATLAVLRVPDPSGEYGTIAVNNAIKAINGTADVISRLSGIKSRVLALLHAFVTDVYYEKSFEVLAESIFDKYKSDVDVLITKECGDILQKIPSVMDRLNEDNSEAISQALVTCRRIIEAFADSIFPPSDEVIQVDGNELKLDSSKYMNRINAFVIGKTESKSRRTKLRQNLSNIYDRVSTGVHKDVTAEEAKALFLNTYLFLGEILHLGNRDATNIGNAE
ncbi:MAG: hypothetical protein K0R63_411 [Rickettsiales bacterium]|jgi:hypothetical protein|nr:hypothetical protein [Rickettsiales bacterium]